MHNERHENFSSEFRNISSFQVGDNTASGENFNDKLSREKEAFKHLKLIIIRGREGNYQDESDE
jgi:hypothetical protein